MNDQSKPIPTSPDSTGFRGHPNVQEAIRADGVVEENESGAWHTSDSIIRDKILFIIQHYPIVSRAMLQVGIGTSIPPTIWNPIVDRLIREGKLAVDQFQAESPGGRIQTYTRIMGTGTTAA